MHDTANVRGRAPARSGGRRLWSSALGLLVAAVLAVGVNMLADRLLSRARIDLTQQHLYTLSDGTRQVLAGITDPITLRLFYSRKLGAEIPVYGAYADRVREMLAEYVALSKGKIRLEVLDPEPFSELEDRALAYGLQGVPVDQSGEQVYFGLAGTNLVDDERTIAFFQPDRERFLEYDLTRLVYELSNPRRPVIGVMSPLPLNGDPRAMMLRQPQLARPATVMTQLHQFFTVKDVRLDAQVIDPDIQVLLVAQPQNLSEATQYAIDQFVMRGGKLLLLVDPHSEAQASRPNLAGQPQANTASSLDRLLNAWGVEAPSDKVVLDLRGAWRVRANPQDRVQAVDYTAWYNLQADSLNRSEVALAQLDQVTVASAGELRKREGAKVDFVPLLTSSPESMVVDAKRVREDPNPVRLLADFRADGQRHVLAARIRGELASAFPDGPPALPEGQSRPENFPAHLAHSAGPANVVVINDTDILEDRFWVRTGLLRPAGGDPDQRQRLAGREPGGHADGQRFADLAPLPWRVAASLRAGGGYPAQCRCSVPPDRTAIAAAAGGDGAPPARIAPGRARRRGLRRAGPGADRHHARAAGRDRQGAGRDPAHAAGTADRAARAPAGHREAGDRAPHREHRPGAGAADHLRHRAGGGPRPPPRRRA